MDGQKSLISLFAWSQGALLSAIALVGLGCIAAAQAGPGTPVPRVYANASLSFRYVVPNGMRDKTNRFSLQLKERAKAAGRTKTLGVLLAMSSGLDDKAPSWRSLTIETYPRNAVSDADDLKAKGKMSAWVVDSEDTGTFRSVIVSGQQFSVSVFGQQEGSVKKVAVVWTTVRRGTLLSFAFVGNSADQLKKLTESMNSVQFF